MVERSGSGARPRPRRSLRSATAAPIASVAAAGGVVDVDAPISEPRQTRCPAEEALPDQPEAPTRQRDGHRSRATIAEELAAESRGARVPALLAPRLDPNDMGYLSAPALDARDRVVKTKATAVEFPDALIQLEPSGAMRQSPSAMSLGQRPQ